MPCTFAQATAAPAARIHTGAGGRGLWRIRSRHLRSERRWRGGAGFRCCVQCCRDGISWHTGFRSALRVAQHPALGLSLPSVRCQHTQLQMTRLILLNNQGVSRNRAESVLCLIAALSTSPLCLIGTKRGCVLQLFVSLRSLASGRGRWSRHCRTGSHHVRCSQ